VEELASLSQALARKRAPSAAAAATDAGADAAPARRGDQGGGPPPQLPAWGGAGGSGLPLGDSETWHVSARARAADAQGTGAGARLRPPSFPRRRAARPPALLVKVGRKRTGRPGAHRRSPQPRSRALPPPPRAAGRRLCRLVRVGHGPPLRGVF
jgi:hypothetical protein